MRGLLGDAEPSDAADAEPEADGACDGGAGGTSYEPLREQHETERFESELERGAAATPAAAATTASTSTPNPGVEAIDSKYTSLSAK